MSAIELDEIKKYCNKEIKYYKKIMRPELKWQNSYEYGYESGYMEALQDLLDKIKSLQEQSL